MAYEIELKAWVDDAAETKNRMNAAADFLFSYTKEDVYWYSKDTAAFPSGVRLRKESRTFKTGAQEICLFVTYKTKETRDGIEINDEKEFRITSVSDGGSALDAAVLVPTAPAPDAAVLVPTVPAPDAAVLVPTAPVSDTAAQPDAAIPSNAAAPFETFLTLAGFAAGFTKKKAGTCWSHRLAGASTEGRALFHSITAELSLIEGLGHFLELEIITPDDTTATVQAAREALLNLLKTAGIPASRIESRYYSEMLQSRC